MHSSRSDESPTLNELITFFAVCIYIKETAKNVISLIKNYNLGQSYNIYYSYFLNYNRGGKLWQTYI